MPPLFTFTYLLITPLGTKDTFSLCINPYMRSSVRVRESFIQKYKQVINRIGGWAEESRACDEWEEK